MRSGSTANLRIVAKASGQYILSAPAADFFNRVTWQNDIATRWRPDDSPKSPVVIDPDLRFGAPTVRGISTEILSELSEGGEDEQDLANTYGLTLQEVRWALAYEATQAQAA